MNYSRKNLKKQAKAHLKGSFWTGFGVTYGENFIKTSAIQLISFIFFSLFYSGFSYTFIDRFSNLQVYDSEEAIQFFFETEKMYLPFFLINFIRSGLIVITGILLLNHFKTGANLWFLRNRERSDSPSFSLLFYNLKKGNYTGTLKGMAWRDLWYAIWRLPLFILRTGTLVLSYLGLREILRFALENYRSYYSPSRFAEQFLPAFSQWWWLIIMVPVLMIIFSVILIVKKYDYLSAEWLLADNPNMNYREALTLSRKMVYGYKWKWFVLDLSFLGWKLLLLLLAVFSFFLSPLLHTYINATYAEFYAFLRAEAVQKGLVTYEQLGFVRVDSESGHIPTASEFYQNQRTI